MTSQAPMIPWVCVKEEIDDTDDDGNQQQQKQEKTEQAGSQRINSQVERQRPESRKLVLLKHEARKEREGKTGMEGVCT